MYVHARACLDFTWKGKYSIDLILLQSRKGVSQHVEVFSRAGSWTGHGLCHGHHGNVLWSSWSLSRNLLYLSRWRCSGFTMTVVWPNWTFQQSLPPAFHGSWPHTGPLPWVLGGCCCLLCCYCAPKWMPCCATPARPASGSIMKCWLYWQCSTSISKG